MSRKHLIEGDIPAKYRQLVGTTKTFQGGVFSPKRAIPPTEFFILGIRWGLCTVMSVTQIQEKGSSDYKYPTFELLVKNDTMRAARWTRGFPIPEINLKEEGGEAK